MENLKNIFQQILINVLPIRFANIIKVERTQVWSNGDFTFPCFYIAKMMGEEPHILAINLANKIKIDGASVVAVGSYLNLKLNPELRIKLILNSIMSVTAYGSTIGHKTVIIEYSSPNIAKLFTIGHLRSTMIGHSLVQINRFLGNRVIRINHLGDWGTQFGVLLAAYTQWAEQDNPRLEKDFSWMDTVNSKISSPLYRLFQLYVKFHKAELDDPSLHEQAKDWFVRLESGDQKAVDLWMWFRRISLEEFARVYKRLGVEFDYMDMGEAFYQKYIASTVDLLVNNHLLKEGEGGAQIVDLKDVGIDTPCLVQKSDGSSLYATRDITAAIFRKNMWNFDSCLYVVGSDQLLHFRQVFAVMKKIDIWYNNRMVHIPFGMISLPHGKISTRKGNVIFLEDVLDEAVSRVKKIIDTKNPDLIDKESVAETLGVGAVIFFNALNDRLKPIKFDWDHVLALDGDTGPYIQYAHARIMSLLRKAGEFWVELATPNNSSDIDSAIISYHQFEIKEKLVGLDDDSVQALLFTLADMPNVYRMMQKVNMGTILARQLLGVTKAFSVFYSNCNILHNSVTHDIRYARLLLCVATARVLRQGLHILGIRTPNAM